MRRWRSWNAYHGNINQQTMESIMDKLVQRNRSVDGVPTSLADIGYTVAGLDDNVSYASGVCSGRCNRSLEARL